VRVLCVNHTGVISGAERSLLDLLAGLSERVEVRVACPSAGPLADAVRRAGIPVDPIPGTDGSLKLRPRETPLAVGRLTGAAVRTAIHAQRMGADVIHANSIRAGLLTVVAARLIGVPAVVHVRDRLPRSRVADACIYFIAAGAEVVVANSTYTAEGVRSVTERGRVEVVYNPVDLSRFARSRLDREGMRKQLGLSVDALVLAVIGQITPWKGQYEAVQALARLRRRGTEAHLLVVGEPKFVSAATRYDNLAYHTKLRQLIAAERLTEHVRLLGERSDIPAVMGALDVVLVPSWEEPFGRVVVEAMALGLPVLATSVGGPAEIIRDGEGILVAPRDPERLADAIACLASSAELRASLGNAAAGRANDFALANHVAAMRGVYHRAISER
jgi:glycosyltransferase involved in cell wall biosynthesis